MYSLWVVLFRADGLDVPQRTAVAVCTDRRRQIGGPSVSINNVPDNLGRLENVEKKTPERFEKHIDGVIVDID